MALKFSAFNPGGESKPGDDPSILQLTAAENTDVIFKLDGEGEVIDSPVIRRQEDNSEVGDIELAADRKTATATYTVTAAQGTFVASAKVGEAQMNATNGVKLVSPSETMPSGPASTTESKPSELEIGELDRPFAYVTLAFVVLLSAAVGITVWSVISRVLLPSAGALVAEDELVDGSFGQRMASIVLVIGAGFGGIVITIGAWLAAIETRGRLRAPIKGAATKGASEGLAKDELEAIAKIMDAARRLRGSIAVVLSGFFILAISMWGMNAMTAGTPTPVPSQTGEAVQQSSENGEPAPAEATPTRAR
ncbi:hypothetical protein [Diaminobutyricimonas sp. LJ205]|uniref:hypothetical protein n=1 Tax=Diaminobutyricimonas sp. LJ205 TaxID=2683590 RepID=UPI0012F51298|nr:hypothetical protein [Diaminobutyricimonas sp. LJ205]